LSSIFPATISLERTGLHKRLNSKKFLAQLDYPSATIPESLGSIRRSLNRLSNIPNSRRQKRPAILTYSPFIYPLRIALIAFPSNTPYSSNGSNLQEFSRRPSRGRWPASLSFSCSASQQPPKAQDRLGDSHGRGLDHR
jgi:hypothetical protein